MRRRQINKKHGLKYTPREMTKAIEDAGLSKDGQTDHNEADVVKIETELVKLGK